MQIDEPNHDSSRSRGRQTRVYLRVTKLVAAAVLGLLLPMALMYQSHLVVTDLGTAVASSEELGILSTRLPEPIRSYRSPNDYAVLAIAYVETSNQRAMLNKQRMKIAVMHIGFAVMCVGLLFVLLGVDQGGIEVGGAIKDASSVNVKVASTGLAVFVLGAAMALAGGVLPNTYTTVGIPGFVGKPEPNGITSASGSTKFDELPRLFDFCESETRTAVDRRTCLLNAASTLIR